MTQEDRSRVLCACPDPVVRSFLEWGTGDPGWTVGLFHRLTDPPCVLTEAEFRALNPGLSPVVA